MRNFYRIILKEKNIERAIQTICLKQSSITSGPDRITKFNLPDKNEVKRQVKLRLRRRIKTNSRIIEIHESKGKKRQVVICNLYDRMAQQAIYQIIQDYGILEQNMSEYSFGYRQGISSKIPASRVANCVYNFREYYTIKMDLKKCFDNISLDDALNSLRNLGINDIELIKTIKHLMWISKEYNGVGLGQGTILGPLLCNCYLTKLDNFMENCFNLKDSPKYHIQARRKYGDNFVNWLLQRNYKIPCKYYRYADDFIIFCKSEIEQNIVHEKIKNFIDNELRIDINQQKTKIGKNEPVIFLGFWFCRFPQNILIKPSNEKKILDKIKSFKIGNHNEAMKYVQYCRGILNYYDICNNMKTIVTAMAQRMWVRGVHRNSLFKKDDDHQIFREKHINNKRKQIVFDPWKMRRQSKLSFKEYMMNNGWIHAREYISEAIENEYSVFKRQLFTCQKGKDPITKESLNLANMVIHHIKSVEFGGNNDINNLILINKDTHCLIHGKISDNKKIRKYQKALKGKN